MLTGPWLLGYQYSDELEGRGEGGKGGRREERGGEGRAGRMRRRIKKGGRKEREKELRKKEGRGREDWELTKAAKIKGINAQGDQLPVLIKVNK